MADVSPAQPPRWRRPMWILAGALLLAPALAMRLTSEVSWGPGDFLAFGVLLFATCAGIEAAMRFGTRPSIRRALALAVLCTGLFVWVELAVGIVGPG